MTNNSWSKLGNCNLGYVDYENMFSDAETIKEKFKTEKVTNNTNPIEKQNEFVQSLGVEGEVFTSVFYEASSSDVDVSIEENGHKSSLSRKVSYC